MFDYQRWSGWLEAEAAGLQAQGFYVRFSRAEAASKPGSSLGASSSNVTGTFALWSTGEADYDVTDGGAQAISHKWGLQLSDQTVVAAFQEFTGLLLEHR